MFAPKRVSRGTVFVLPKLTGHEVVSIRFFRRLASLVAGLLVWLVPAPTVLAQTNAYALLQQQAVKLAGSTSSSEAGKAVAISADGLTAVVGNPGDNSGVGGAQIYVWSAGEGDWVTQGSELVGAGSTGSPRQGTAVAIFGD